MAINKWRHEQGRVIVGLDISTKEGWACVSLFLWSISVSWK
jgi:hypothetical protein